MTCARCFKEIEEGSAFCRFCGAAVSGGPAGPATPRPRRLTRIPEQGQLGGVCAGIAAYLDTDVTLIRLAWVILSIVPGLLLGGVLVYVVCWMLLPVATPEERHVYNGPRLTRSVTNRMIGGVCAGIAEYFGLDATVVRIVAVVLGVYPGAIIGGVLAYVIAWLVIPPASEPLTTVSSTA